MEGRGEAAETDPSFEDALQDWGNRDEQSQRLLCEIEPDALMQACGQEPPPSGTASRSLRKAASDGRTRILTAPYFVGFGGFIALTVWLPTYWSEQPGNRGEAPSPGRDGRQ